MKYACLNIFEKFFNGMAPKWDEEMFFEKVDFCLYTIFQFLEQYVLSNICYFKKTEIALDKQCWYSISLQNRMQFARLVFMLERKYYY